MTQSKNDLINMLLNSKSINEQLNKLHPSDLKDDMKQHLYLTICEMTDEKLLNIHRECDTCLERFVAGIIRNQFKSSTSPFYKKYRLKQDENAVKQHLENDILPDNYNPEYVPINYEKVMSFLRSQHPKKAQLFKAHFIDGMTYRQIAKQYNIKYTTVYMIIQSVVEEIKCKVKLSISK